MRLKELFVRGLEGFICCRLFLRDFDLGLVLLLLDLFSDCIALERLEQVDGVLEADGPNLHGEVDCTAAFGAAGKAIPSPVSGVRKRSGVLLRPMNRARSGVFGVAFAQTKTRNVNF